VADNQINNNQAAQNQISCFYLPFKFILYGSPVWGQSTYKYIQKNDFGHLDKLPFEELHNKMCKRILNVGKYSSNLAARAELGRYPLIICIAAQAVKFLSQVASSPGKLSHQAYLEEKNNRGDSVKQSYVTVISASLTYLTTHANFL